ncbi:MAG: hypothetical protein R2690_10905 [Acidimicrobiales bacterium]
MTIEMQPRPSGKPTLSERIVRRLSELGPKHCAAASSPEPPWPARRWRSTR